jgi:uncharacterized protein (DUF433 family)
MTTVMDGHIVVDDKGIARVGKTRMKVLQLVQAMKVDQLSPEQATQEFPLTLSDVHAALAYFYDHPEEMESQQREESRFDEEFRARHPNKITRAELERRLAERGEKL